jgi:hypothetical protein
LIDESKLAEDLASTADGSDAFIADADFELATEEDVDAGINAAFFDDDISWLALEEAGGVEDLIELLLVKAGQGGHRLHR